MATKSMARPTGKLGVFLAGSGVGAAAEYLLDPERGRRRRHVLRDQAIAKLRHGSREAERRAHDVAHKARGVVAEATPPGRDSSELNDPTLAAKVESELFRPADAPKGSININVEKGVVYLRGQVESQEQMDGLLARTRDVDGVTQVENLLHLPGSPPPHKI
jgi:BON domain